MAQAAPACENAVVVVRLLKRGLLAGAIVVGAETAYAVLWPAPELESFDPSREFGDPALPTLRVAVLGDSSVTAPGVSTAADIWVSRVCERLSHDYHVILASFAQGGSTAGDLIDDQLSPAIEFQPDVVLVAVGANDAMKGGSLRKFEKNLDALIGRLAQTGATIVQSGVGDLGSIPRLHPPLENLMSHRALRFDRAHWRVAERHGTTVIDQRSDDLAVWYSDRGLWADDRFHVSANGHERWAENAWRSIAPLMRRTSESV